MRTFIFIVLCSLGVAAQANPFDQFAGSYTLVGTPAVRPTGNAFCREFNFANVTGMNIKIAPTGGYYRQTHVIQFKNGGTQPIYEYRDDSGFGNDEVSVVVTTDGGNNFALNTMQKSFVEDSRHSNEIRQIMVNGKNPVHLSIDDQVIDERGFPYKGCKYEATFHRR